MFIYIPSGVANFKALIITLYGTKYEYINAYTYTRMNNYMINCAHTRNSTSCSEIMICSDEQCVKTPNIKP